MNDLKNFPSIIKKNGPIKDTFFGSPQELFLKVSEKGVEFDTTKNHSRLLSLDQQTLTSDFIKILMERRLEERGNDQEKLRGMPLTMNPLSKSDLFLIKLWSRKGCPTPTGLLCTPLEGS